jgi:hypothetical protein
MLDAPPQRRSWWDRNWKWVVPVGCLGLAAIPVAFVLGILGVVFGAMRSAGPVDEAVRLARANRQVVEALGEPVEKGWLVGGSINVTGPSGRAELSIPLSGPKGSGKLYLIADKRAGRWEFELAEVEIEGRGERIDLLADRASPGWTRLGQPPRLYHSIALTV